MNRTQKILSRFVQGATGASLEGGTFVRIRPHAVLTHDNTAAVMSKFESLGDTRLRVRDPQQLVFALDHNVQDTSAKVLAVRPS